MDFLATSSMENQPIVQRSFRTTDKDFATQVRRFLDDVGSAVRFEFMLDMIEHNANRQGNWNQISLTKEISLTLTFGNIYCPQKLIGDIHVTRSYTVKAADPGFYEQHLEDISYQIPGLFLPCFRDFFDFVDW